MRHSLAIVLLGLPLLTATAHHSVAPFFDQGTTLRLTGVVQRWIFKNPHPVLVVEVADESGGAVAWQVHFAPATALAKRGWTAETFRPGDRVIATGHPSRQPGTHGLEHRDLQRADDSPVVPRPAP